MYPTKLDHVVVYMNDIAAKPENSIKKNEL